MPPVVVVVGLGLVREQQDARDVPAVEQRRTELASQRARQAGLPQPVRALDGVANDGATGEADNVTDAEVVIGGAGNDSYGFDTDLALGADTLNEAGGGVDTLNFSATTTRSIVLNLGLATSQTLYMWRGKELLKIWDQYGHSSFLQKRNPDSVF
jgi:hypothetical protein